MPGPGSRRGQEVTMRQSRFWPCTTMAGAATACAIPNAPAPASTRRVIIVISPLRPSPPGVKMMHRTVAGADLDPVGGGNRGAHIGLGGPRRGDQVEPLGEARRER